MWVFSSCNAQTSHWSGFCFQAQAPGMWAPVAVAHELSSCGSQALDTGSIVVVHRLSPMACGVFLDQRSNLSFLLWQEYSLPLSHQENPSWIFIWYSADSLLVWGYSALPLKNMVFHVKQKPNTKSMLSASCVWRPRTNKTKQWWQESGRLKGETGWMRDMRKLLEW